MVVATREHTSCDRFQSYNLQGSIFAHIHIFAAGSLSPVYSFALYNASLLDLEHITEPGSFYDQDHLFVEASGTHLL